MRRCKVGPGYPAQLQRCVSCSLGADGEDHAALPLALPAAAAAAGLAYLNARYAVSYDYELLSSLVSAHIRGRLDERNDRISLFYALEAQATSANRHRPWIISAHSGEQWTYAEAYEIVLQYAAWLKTKGVRKEDVVAIDFMNSDVFIWLWFALWSIGAKPAFINYNLTGAPLFHTVRTSTARLVLVDKHGRDKFEESTMAEHGFATVPPIDGQKDNHRVYGFSSDLPELPRAVHAHAHPTNVTSQNSTVNATPEPRRSTYLLAHTLTAQLTLCLHSAQLEIVFFDKRLENHILSLPPTRVADSERGGQQVSSMAMLIYTSGTTGLPKAAIMSWGKARIGSRFAQGWINLKPTDVLYTSMPLYHSAASVLGK